MATDAELKEIQETFRLFETTSTVRFELTIDSFQEKFRNFFLKTGYTPASLDPTDKSSDEQIEQRLVKAAARIRKYMALNILVEFETTNVAYSEKSVANIQQQVRSLLDKAGEPVTAQIEDRLQSAGKHILAKRDPQRHYAAKPAEDFPFNAVSPKHEKAAHQQEADNSLIRKVLSLAGRIKTSDTPL